ncbi:Nif3-like dinuclear metal center hexameric protein, partial [Leptolyngbya cf. ectocarpi LEGE 11479]
MNVDALINWVEAWAPPGWQESWDNCGWQIEPGIGSQPAGVLVCLTPTLAVMAEAIRLKEEGAPVNLIFAHHPLIFSPLKSVTAGEPVADMVRLAITHGIGVYSAHTNFDQVADGTADVLAQLLQLQNSVPVVPTQEGLGYGRVGDLPSSQSLEDLLALIQAKLNPPNLIHSPSTNLQQMIE